MTMMETDRLILRNFRESDIEDYWEYVQMENVGPRAGWPAYTDRNKAVDRLNIEMEKPDQFAIVLKKENKVIGSVELMACKRERYSMIPTPVEDNAKEIGFVLSARYWGNGYMPEAAKKVMEYGFETLGVSAIYIGHAKANTNSGRVQDKLGFRVIGEQPNYRTWIDGKETDFVARKMTKEEWDSKKQHR